MQNIFTFVLVALAGGGLLAQTPAPGAQSHGNATIVTGCLTAGPNDTFTLTAADPDASGGGAAASTGTSATTPTGSKVIKTIAYALSPNTNVDLKSHVGQKVEVSGSETTGQASATSVDSSTATSPATRGTSGARPTVSTTAQAQVVARQFNVDTIKTVADKCDMLK